jgi:uncharacterized membrane protein
MTPLLIAALALLGLIAGIYVSALIHDWRIGDLSATQYAAMHQMRDKTFRRVMPVIGLTTVALVAASAAFAVDPGLPRVLAWIATALLVTDIVLTVTRQVPLNLTIQGWTETTIPADWTQVRDQWASQHHVRTVLCVMAYACLLGAVLLMLDGTSNV